MPDILTLTLNPTIDVSADVSEVVPNAKLRCTDGHLDPGGGGVNVARAIRFLGGDATAMLATAGVTGRLLMEMLAAEGIPVLAFETPGLTRQAFAVRETASGDQYRFVMPGTEWTADMRDRFLAEIEARVGADSLVVASGSLPPGVPPEYYGDINDLVAKRGGRTILDTSGPALARAAVRRTDHPLHVLRMDWAEARELSGRPIETQAELGEFAAELVGRGIARYVVMSLGPKGTLGASADEQCFCAPPKVDVVSAVGAGDSMVAALTLGLSRGWAFSRAVAFGTAAAASAVTTPATRLCDRDLAERFLDEVRVGEA